MSNKSKYFKHGDLTQDLTTSRNVLAPDPVSSLTYPEHTSPYNTMNIACKRGNIFIFVQPENFRTKTPLLDICCENPGAAPLNRTLAVSYGKIFEWIKIETFLWPNPPISVCTLFSAPGTCLAINIYVNSSLQRGYYAYKYLLKCNTQSRTLVSCSQ